jgi:leucyl-tRNA synthetase
MVLSPEHKLVPEITTAEQKQAVEDYKKFAAGKSDLERNLPKKNPAFLPALTQLIPSMAKKSPSGLRITF